VYIWLEDEAGNKDIKEENIIVLNIVYDITLPTAENILPKGKVHTKPIISAWLRDINNGKFQGEIDKASIEVLIDGKKDIIERIEFASYTQVSQQKFERNNLQVYLKYPLSAGRHKISIKLKDKAGNLSEEYICYFEVSTEAFIGFCNYPNPAQSGGSTKFRYIIGEPAKVSINIYDVAGNIVAYIDCGYKQPGIHDQYWNCLDQLRNKLPNGIYFAELVIKNDKIVKKYIKIAIKN
jgi:hypothetical protein